MFYQLFSNLLRALFFDVYANALCLFNGIIKYCKTLTGFVFVSCKKKKSNLSDNERNFSMNLGNVEEATKQKQKKGVIYICLASFLYILAMT